KSSSPAYSNASWRNAASPFRVHVGLASARMSFRSTREKTTSKLGLDDRLRSADGHAVAGGDRSAQHRKRNVASRTRNLPNDVIVGHDVSIKRKRLVSERLQYAQVTVHMAARIDPAYELLSDEAALRERDRVGIERRLLGDRALIDVGAHARHALADAYAFVL